MQCSGGNTCCACLPCSLLATEIYTCVAALLQFSHVLHAWLELCRGNFLVIVSGGKRLDFAAFVLILTLSVLLCWGMKETKTVNNGPFRVSLPCQNSCSLRLSQIGSRQWRLQCTD